MPDHDFWLFDDAIVVRLEYDEAGRFLRPVAVSDPAPYRQCRDVVMARAVAFRPLMICCLSLTDASGCTATR